jgi:hypothetical protein
LPTNLNLELLSLTVKSCLFSNLFWFYIEFKFVNFYSRLMRVCFTNYCIHAIFNANQLALFQGSSKCHQTKCVCVFLANFELMQFQIFYFVRKGWLRSMPNKANKNKKGISAIVFLSIFFTNKTHCIIIKKWSFEKMVNWYLIVITTQW